MKPLLETIKNPLEEIKSLIVTAERTKSKNKKAKLSIRIGLIYDQLALITPRKRKFYQKQAIEYFKRASKVKSKEIKVKALNGLSIVYLHQHNLNLAERLLKKSLKLKRSPTILNSLGNVYKAMKDFKKALQFYSKAFSLAYPKQKDLAQVALKNIIYLFQSISKVKLKDN
jgi:tetratricopeptide (TPR) repeat protein